MHPPTFRLPRTGLLLAVGGLALVVGLFGTSGRADKPAAPDLAAEYTADVKPALTKYCLNCHSTKALKGDLDLERFTSINEARQDAKVWQNLLEQLEAGEMPPKKSAQPKPEEREKLMAWVRRFLDAEARARAGDPGRVVVRRLSNVEYNHTIRDLTGVDLQPARDFPNDGAAGEGFTNAGDALVMSPTLLNKYLGAAKEVAGHSVLLPEGFRFSPAKTRRDWTDEVIARIRVFQGQFGDGKLNVGPYLSATVRYRDELSAGKITIDAVAAKEKLNAKYLQALWETLNDRQPSFPLDAIRARWRSAGPNDVAALTADVRAWQTLLWKFNKIGSYMAPVWQEAAAPNFAPAANLKLRPTPPKGQNEVVLYLTARVLTLGKDGTHVVWHRPHFEGTGQVPFLLRDVAAFPGPFEVDHRAAFGDTAKLLNAAAEAKNGKADTAALAQKHGVDAAMLKRWLDFLASEPPPEETPKAPVLQLLPKKLPDNAQKPAIKGWGDTTPDTLPVVVSNASDKEEKIPGTAAPHKVVVHPSPSQLAVVAWNSPTEGSVRVEARVAHAHHPGGNGVAWWLEQRRGETVSAIESGVIDSGKKAEAKPTEVKVQKGDLIVLAIGARDGNHICDLTGVDLTITELADKKRTWDLGGDVADTILEANPHADKHGNKEVWQFAKAADPTVKGKPTTPRIPRDSVLSRWREAVADPKKTDQLGKLAEQVQELLIGDRPDLERGPDRTLYDLLTGVDGPLLRGSDLTRLVKARPQEKKENAGIGLPPERFGKHPQGGPAEEASLIVAAPSVVEVRVPAAVFQSRDFVVEGRLDAGSAGAVVQFEVLTAPPKLDALAANASGVAAGSADLKALAPGFDAFRRVFPQYLFYPKVVPDDEVICLRLYFREDEALTRLVLSDEQKRQLDALWAELRYVSQYPLTEQKNYPTFMGFVSQEGPEFYKRLDTALRDGVRQRAETFEADQTTSQPKHIQAVLDFAGRAYRRPLTEKEKTDLTQLYETLRKKELKHEEAFRTILARVLISPSFLYRLEPPAEGKAAEPVTNHELATRLSYFLWATMPDEELRQAAAAGKLSDPQVLSAQVARMLRDPKARGLATEFALQWLHVRDIRENKEKNEKLFPTFDDRLRDALFEESALFFTDMFQNDRSVLEVLDADHTFLNDTLAKHYGIPNVNGPQWRRVDGVRKHGRGGILTMGSMLAGQSGASRTSPVLRGNWIIESLLGEKVPKPPKDVPRLPEEEAGDAELTVRQLVEKHASVAQCAVCHVRIDPYGFALEKYDPIGRFREKDLGGRPVDTKAQLRDGTRFDGIDGLRDYLLKQRKEDFLRQFCRKLLGYSLGRAVTLSDQTLVEEMMAELKKNDYRFSAAVHTIARSQQFRYHRGRESGKED